ncbi:hypothetical protein MNBD_GAMMA26-1774 [hydrothermal vent metagenome]|uniref:DUF2231 domain-containing protein n=1 Tax=hydrothermal vent metagenome TaxID=652676 RepID=A0A3B1B9I9_9ZZZZ
MPEIIPNLHPVFVHFTVALLSISTGLFVVLHLFGSHLPENLRLQLRTVARWNLWFGAGITVITVAAGFHAYNTVAHDAPSHAVMTDHRNWALATAPLFIGLALWSITRVWTGKALGGWFVIALLIAQLLLLSTAWRGGEVVYRYGLGVMSLPQSEGEGHAHSHGEGHGATDKPMDFSGMDEMSDGHAH